MTEHTCTHCGKVLGSAEAVEMHTRAKHEKQKPIRIPRAPRKMKRWIILGIIVLVVIGAIYMVATKKSLPDTTMQNHIEVIPPSQMIFNPLDPRVHRHLLEHFDGAGRGAVIINYDCKTYTCEADLLEKLEAFTNYTYVFVAPFERMKAKIVLTSLGRQRKLNEYNKGVIESFIRS